MQINWTTLLRVPSAEECCTEEAMSQIYIYVYKSSKKRRVLLRPDKRVDQTARIVNPSNPSVSMTAVRPLN
jgi:hypothetical protein